MGTKAIHFFIRRDELAQAVLDLEAALGVEVVAADGSRWSAAPQGSNAPLFLRPKGNHPPVSEISPPREGWLVIAAPPETEQAIYETSVGGKDQWIGMAEPNPAVRKLFGAVSRHLKKQLKFGVIGTNVVLQKSAKYSQVGYTQGAVDWFDSGGEWRQEGVKNVVFGPARG